MIMTRIPLVLLLSVSAGCSDRDHASGSGHDGEGEHGHGEHHHGHGGSEYPAESVTIWTDKAELFMEWEALTVGRQSSFLAHITDMANRESFTAVAEGTLSLTLAVEGQAPVTVQAQEPARLGIFIPNITPSVPGPCTLTVALTSKSLSEVFHVEPCVVHADEASAMKSASDEPEPAGQIAFLKEQQWPIAFATGEARVQELTPSTAINAQIKAVPGREAKLTASIEGRLLLASPPPILGSHVKKGQVLALIQPTLGAAGNLGALQADVSAAQAELSAAEAASARIERLVASDSIPKRRLEEATATLGIARAKLQAAQTRLSSYRVSAAGRSRATAGAFRVASPIDGTLVDQNVTEGETVSAGSLLFTVIDLERVWVEGRVFEPDVPKVEGAREAWFTVDGRNTVFEIAGDTGRLVTIGHVLDAKSRTVPVVYEVQNPDKKIRIGQFAKLSVATGPPMQALVIPEAALIQDGNQTIVFVHASGEAFQRRVVALGSRSRGLAEVKSGLQAGERVVTVGAYDLKLAASAGGAPAHGHAH